MKKLIFTLVVCPVFLVPISDHSVVSSASASTVVDVTGTGRQKMSVEIRVANPAFANCLRKNLELTGLFTVQATGSIKVTGDSGTIRADGPTHALPMTMTFTDDGSARMAARRASDAICQTFGKQKGFAQDPVLFLNRGRTAAKGGALPAELCTCYPDGGDIRQLTSDGKMVIFQRWMKDRENVIYISDKSGAPQIWKMNVRTRERKMLWSLKGTPTGIAVSPDGNRIAAILSVSGNPDLYVIDMGRGSFHRMTKTDYEVEGQPTWSPDGTQIAFVRGDRSQQIWVVNVATGKERRLTSRGRKNVDPDWGPNGQIAYVAGSDVMVMSATAGDSESRKVSDISAKWEHPSWSCDGRHLTASRDKTIFVIDTLEDGDKPKPMFHANGNWIAPCWAK